MMMKVLLSKKFNVIYKTKIMFIMINLYLWAIYTQKVNEYL